MAKGKFMQGLKGSPPKVVSAQDIDDIAEKLHSKPVFQQPAPPPAEKPAIAARKREPEPVPEPKEELHRLTLDIPKELFEQAKVYKKRSGVTLKGLIVALLNDFFEEQDANPPQGRLPRRPGI